MAKFVYTTLLGAYGNLQFEYDEQTLKLDLEWTSKYASYTDTGNGGRIILEGSGLTYGPDTITGGTVNKITFEDSDGKTFVTVTDGDFKGKEIDQMLTGTNGVELFLDKIRSGKDTIVGSDISDYINAGMGNDRIDAGKAADTLDGGKGNDRLHGGAGSDTFLISPGKDVVDDFDANGGGDRQDYIQGHKSDFDIEKSGHDVILHADGGGSLTLLDVKPSEITAADFHILT